MGNNMDYTINDWREYKKYFGMTTADISVMTGLAEQSILNATSKGYVRKYGMPTWAVSAIRTWKMGIASESVRNDLFRSKLIELINNR
jgi:hypothetical protein